jgi:hypothetical protein
VNDVHKIAQILENVHERFVVRTQDVCETGARGFVDRANTSNRVVTAIASGDSGWTPVRFSDILVPEIDRCSYIGSHVYYDEVGKAYKAVRK